MTDQPGIKLQCQYCGHLQPLDLVERCRQCAGSELIVVALAAPSPAAPLSTEQAIQKAENAIAHRPTAGLRERIEQLPRNITGIDYAQIEWVRLKEVLALLEAERGTPQCEFCNQPDGDPPSMLEVCPSCWNRANEGSGWMQRALSAEQQLKERGTPAEPQTSDAIVAELDALVDNDNYHRGDLVSVAFNIGFRAGRATTPQEPEK